MAVQSSETVTNCLLKRLGIINVLGTWLAVFVQMQRKNKPDFSFAVKTPFESVARTSFAFLAECTEGAREHERQEETMGRPCLLEAQKQAHGYLHLPLPALRHVLNARAFLRDPKGRARKTQGGDIEGLLRFEASPLALLLEVVAPADTRMEVRAGGRAHHLNEPSFE